MSIRSEIELRLGRRIQAEKDIRALKPPGLLCVDAMKDFQAIYKEKREEFMDNSMMETHDMRVLIGAIDLICMSAEAADQYITLAWNSRQIDEELQKYLDRRAHEESQAREKAAKGDKKQGELTGQLNIFDDKSEAEGGAVSCRTIDDYVKACRECQDILGMSETEYLYLFAEKGFDGAVLPEQQVTVYADVLDELKVKVDALPGAVLGCSTDLRASVADYILADNDADAVIVLQHHFNLVHQENIELALQDVVTVIDWTKEQISLEAEKMASSTVAAPEAEPVKPLPEFTITEDATAEILAHFIEGNAPLGVAALLQLIAVQHEGLSHDDQGLILDEQIAKFENMAEAKVAPELNDLEKAAAKRKKAAPKAEKKAKPAKK